MNKCDLYQQRLAENGPDLANTDAELKAHLPGCAACSDFLARLRRVEDELASMGELDAPDALVEKTLQAVEDAAATDRDATTPYRRRRYLAGGLAATVAAAACLVLVLNTPGLWPNPTRLPSADSEAEIAQSREQSDGAGQRADASQQAMTQRNSRFQDRIDLAEQYAENAQSDDSFDVARLAEEMASRSELGTAADDLADLAEPEAETRMTETEAGQFAEDANMPLARRRAEPGHPELNELDRMRLAQSPAPAEKTEESFRQGASGPTAIGNESADVEERVPSIAGRSSALRNEGLLIERLLIGPDELSAHRSNAEPVESESVLDRVGEREVRLRADQTDADTSVSADLSQMPRQETQQLKRGPQSRVVAMANPATLRLTHAGFLERYASMEHAAVQDAVGYWSNSYIPGDPAMRLLAARLDAWDRTELGAGLRLDQAIQPVVQPFDAPTDAAIAVYLSSDTPVVEGPTRLRVQVGLKGADRQGGQRPAMNIGLVIDLRDTPAVDAARQIRAVIEALERARQPDDRFSLTIAGPNGGLVVAPEQFRHGPIRVAIDNLFGDTAETEKPSVELRDALILATEKVLESDDPTAVLGSSLVVLVTASSLADDIARLEDLAHRNAVGGVPMSVIKVGPTQTLDHVDRLVAAGQGNRRVLDTAQAAEAAIDRELHAASRAVARALRLRIRLAPGVQLIDVLGSERLAAPEAQRVREAEQSIDQRLARNLGITADRGEDEDGIQIVIPNFYAGDGHVVLLDVIAPGAGPIADLRVRYKDVAHLRNGVAEANLSIGDQPRTAGPLERNVLENLAAWELSRRVRHAGRVLGAGDVEQAKNLIAALRADISDLRNRVTGWPSNTGLGADQIALDEYVTALNSHAISDPDQRQHLADSLTFAAFRKTQAKFD